jgi:hypothetical protein
MGEGSFGVKGEAMDDDMDDDDDEDEEDEDMEEVS